MTKWWILGVALTQVGHAILWLMSAKELSNRRSHPPTWRWDPSQFRGAPRQRAQREGSELRPAFPPWRSARRPLWASLVYKGGAEGEIVVETRGWRFIFPANVTIQEVVYVVNGMRPPTHL